MNSENFSNALYKTSTRSVEHETLQTDGSPGALFTASAGQDHKVKPVIPVITGPTASGKTGAAVRFALEHNGEIISADSMQIYREMNIGTAKPSEEEQQGIPHHLIDMVNPDQPYSVSQFRSDAIDKIDEILKRGKMPVVCGGTGLYISALTLPFDLETENTDPEIRAGLEQMARTDPEQLYTRLQEADPESAAAIHPHNLKRLVRALEVYEVSGKPKSQLDREGRKKELPYDFKLFAPQIERPLLYERIELRVDLMLEQGLLDEARQLLSKYSRDLMSMQAIGYKELYPYLDGQESLEEAVRILKRDTRRFAKRQLTWFRRDSRIRPLSELSEPGSLAQQGSFE